MIKYTYYDNILENLEKFLRSIVFRPDSRVAARNLRSSVSPIEPTNYPWLLPWRGHFFYTFFLLFFCCPYFAVGRKLCVLSIFCSFLRHKLNIAYTLFFFESWACVRCRRQYLSCTDNVVLWSVCHGLGRLDRWRRYFSHTSPTTDIVLL